MPISKVISTPKLLSVEYVLVFKGRDPQNVHLFHVSKLRPQVRTKEQISVLSNNEYNPQRDNSYWVVHLTEEKDIKFDGKYFDRHELLTTFQEKGAYWIKSIEEVIKAFKDND